VTPASEHHGFDFEVDVLIPYNDVASSELYSLHIEVDVATFFVETTVDDAHSIDHESSSNDDALSGVFVSYNGSTNLLYADTAAALPHTDDAYALKHIGYDYNP
jgi:hypothetical protein